MKRLIGEAKFYIDYFNYRFFGGILYTDDDYYYKGYRAPKL